MAFLLVSVTMAEPRPWVAVACVCERVLQEKDNVNSIIRIVDTFNFELPANMPANTPLPVPVTVFVMLKAGDVAGSHTVEMMIRSPSGKRLPSIEWPVAFAGPDQGAQAAINVTISHPEFEGLYWMDVSWKGDVLTSIPFKLRLLQTQPEGSPKTAH